MKGNLWKGVIAGAFVILTTRPATAITISFQPTATTLVMGDSTAVDVIAARAAGEIVSAFDFDLQYDPSIIRATGLSFGNFLGAPTNFEALTDSRLTTAGLADFAEVSLLTDLSLTGIQSASSQFTLATISFDAVGPGTSLLQFINVGVGGNDIKGANDTVLPPTLQTGSVTVAATVPEPSPFLLLGIGLLWMAFPMTFCRPEAQ